MVVLHKLTEEELRQLDYDEELGLYEDELIDRFNRMIAVEKEISRIKGAPTCEFDEERREAYLLYPDGTRKYYG